MTQKVNIRRYTMYAIGEILLVVAGILIALQVNNWNNDRVDRKKEYEILQDLKVEFEANLKDAERTFLGHNGIVSSMNRLQSLMEHPNEQLFPLVVDSLLFDMFDWFTFTPKPGASDALVNSGDLNLISNKELRNLLVLWSGVVDELKDDEDLALNYSQNIIVPFLSKHYPISNLEHIDYNVSNDFSISLDTVPYIKAHQVEYDISRLLSNTEFKSHVSSKKMQARHNMLEGKVVIRTINQILDAIDNELGK